MRYSVRVFPGVRVYEGKRGSPRSVGLRLLILVILAIAFFQSLFATHYMAAFGMLFLAGFVLPSKKERDRARQSAP